MLRKASGNTIQRFQSDRCLSCDGLAVYLSLPHSRPIRDMAVAWTMIWFVSKLLNEYNYDWVRLIVPIAIDSLSRQNLKNGSRRSMDGKFLFSIPLAITICTSTVVRSSFNEGLICFRRCFRAVFLLLWNTSDKSPNDFGIVYVYLFWKNGKKFSLLVSVKGLAGPQSYFHNLHYGLNRC